MEKSLEELEDEDNRFQSAIRKAAQDLRDFRNRLNQKEEVNDNDKKS